MASYVPSDSEGLVVGPLPFTSSSCPYQSCFCEENVYLLCERIHSEQSSDTSHAHTFVIFISSLAKAFPIWYQKKSACVEEPVFWDYHVILVHNGFVYDHDSILPWGCTLEEYCRCAFPPIHLQVDHHLYEPIFRIIPINEYIMHFASDRTHMPSPTHEDGVPFPNWPLINGTSATSTMTLPMYWNMSGISEKESVTSDGNGNEIDSNGAGHFEKGEGMVVRSDYPRGKLYNRTAFYKWCKQ